MFTKRCTEPAVKIPAGRVPGITRAPLVRSRQPVAKITAFALISIRPSVVFMAFMVFDWSPGADVSSPVGVLLPGVDISSPGAGLVISSTIVSVLYSIPKSSTSFTNRAAYSGPVNSSPKWCRPKPLWIHCKRIPPRRVSLSNMRMLSVPFRFASVAAASPAGPPPTITMS